MSTKLNKLFTNTLGSISSLIWQLEVDILKHSDIEKSVKIVLSKKLHHISENVIEKSIGEYGKILEDELTILNGGGKIE